MAKLTLTALASFVKGYVDASKQAGTWVESHNNLYSVLDKVGKQISIDGNFQDKLGMLDGDNLELGKTIEEYMIDLSMPVDFLDPTNGSEFAEAALKPYLPTVQEASYSYTLGRKVIPTTIPYDNVERGAIDSGVAANMIAKITQKLENSESLYRYGLKKQLLGNMAEKAITAGLTQDIATPIDTTTGENWIKNAKQDIEKAVNFAGEGRSLSKTLIGATPAEDLVLFIKPGILPSIEVDVEAGSFNGTKVALPCKIVVIDDFGSTTNSENIDAMLVDTRGVKLHKDYKATRAQENGFSDYVNIFRHSEFTGFCSKHTFVKVYKHA